MKDKKSGESRRKLIKSIAVGSGAIITGKSLPESWSRPVVDSVLLPAHAQTSGQTYSSTSIQVVSLDPQGNKMFAGVMDGLVLSAHAGIQPPDNPRGCATIVGSDVDLWMQFFILGILTYEIRAIILLSSALTSVTLNYYCGKNGTIDASVRGYTAAYMDILIGKITYQFPAASSCVATLQPPDCE